MSPRLFAMMWNDVAPNSLAERLAPDMYDSRATRMQLLDFRSVQMRTFHLSWLAFFVCFFGWFAHAPLIHTTIALDLGLSREQVLLAFIGSVGTTVVARVVIGILCDRIGPRRSYVYLLLFGAVSIASSAFAWNWASYLVCRLMIGVVGASFVVTQYHTTIMFAPSLVGFANATSAGWGNLGGGATQAVMPLTAAALVALGLSEAGPARWRAAMFVPAVLMLLVAWLYWNLTTDAPEGNFVDLHGKKTANVASIFPALADRRVWLLFLVYGGCFGMELFVNSRAATYFQTKFGLNESMAGLTAGLFGLSNLFARSFGGWFGDRVGARFGLNARVKWLGGVLLLEGLALFAFSRTEFFGAAVVVLLLFSLCVHMAEGATYAIVPFVNSRSVGVVAGVVAAGGNLGAVCFAQYLRTTGVELQSAFAVFAGVVCALSFAAFQIRFSASDEASRQAQLSAA